MRYRDMEAMPYGQEATLHWRVEVLDENVWVLEVETDVESEGEE